MDHKEKVAGIRGMNRWRSFDIRLRSFFRGLDLWELFGKGKEVLEVGCGRGNTISYLCKEFGCIGHGTDLKDFTDKCLIPNAFEFRKGDAHNLSYENNTFDTVYSYYVCPYLEDKLQCLKEAHRVLQVGGKAVIDLGNVGIDNSVPGCEELYDMEISPPFETIMQCMRYQNEGQVKHEVIRIFDQDEKGTFQDRRSNRIIITKKYEDKLVFPELIRSVERYRGRLPFMYCSYGL